MECSSGKQVLTSWSRAERVARDQRRRGKAVVSPYRCPLCSHYHTGSSVGRSNRDHASKMMMRRRMEQRWETE